MSRCDNIEAFRGAMEGLLNQGGGVYDLRQKNAPRTNKQEKVMSYLKGNYEVDNLCGSAEIGSAVKDESLSTKFEDFARAKLGGSIAFVMKNNTFVWDGPEAVSTADKNKL